MKTGRTIEGRGTVDTWNIVSPRLGAVVRLDTAGRTMLRANAGRFSQGMLTGEITADSPRSDQEHDHQGARRAPNWCVIPVRWNWIPTIRPPHTDQYSIGLDREVAGRFALSVAYVRKNGRNFIGWDGSRWQCINRAARVS